MRNLTVFGLAVLAIAMTAALASGGTATRSHGRASTTALAQSLATARLATAKYATSLQRAKADGYQIITQMIPGMGYHYLKPKVTGFNVTKPAILVYVKRGTTYELGALEWVFTSMPAKPPLPGAKYGAFGAGCHYVDGSFVPATTQDACPKTDPQTGAAFNFWHPNLITLHVWLWYPNPSGLFASTNPLVTAFDKG
jgi:hypothetical protein